MNTCSLHVARGALRWQVLPRPHLVFRRSLLGRPERNPASSLPSTPARTRFAPSPTGYVHLGSLRTALYNYLLAKATGGQFLLRLEDTDQKRLVPDAEQRLYEDLKWAGLDWDEGPDIGGPCGPYKQSSRLQLYKEHANQLLENGQAYRCFCTPEELDNMKELAMKESRDLVYNKTCSHISQEESAQRAENGEQHCIRFKHGSKSPIVQDLVYGAYKTQIPPDDFIIIKRDGFPTYHFANVVDDHLMEITHVVRGVEWLVSTPRHVALYDAFGWTQPQFAHVGLLVQNGQKLSKRTGSFSLDSWKAKGILPIALLNYVLLLGWDPTRSDRNDTSQVMEMKDMIEKFHLRFTKGNITVNNKSDFLHKSHMRKLLDQGAAAKEAFFEGLLPDLVSRAKQGGTGLPTDRPLILAARSPEAEEMVSESHLLALLNLEADSYMTPTSFLQRNANLIWQIPVQEYETSLRDRKGVVLDRICVQETSTTATPGEGETETMMMMRPQALTDLLATLGTLLEQIPDSEWTEPAIKEAIGPFIKSIFLGREGEDSGVVVPPKAWGWEFLRWVVNALQPGPALIPTVRFLGREEMRLRINLATSVAQNMERKNNEPQ
ncbi:hypothetical protein F4777DRAFT_406479 [Nemania sp. FL0916]|nr:hypothetical protein F4777DRAFT_406479 [Nemania sp. FL0916]